MSDDKKNAYSEKTVVFAKSNLKETFDARTVVMKKSVVDSVPVVAPTLPPDAPASVSPAAAAPAPAPRVPEIEAPALVLAAEIPPTSATTDPGLQAQPVPAPKKQIQDERRSARKALDRKTKTLVAAFATLCALIVLCLLVAFGGPKATDGAKVAESPVKQKETTDLASTAESSNPGKRSSQGLPDYQSTTDVLGKFDRAAQKAQQHAF